MERTLTKQSVQVELAIHPIHEWLQLLDEENVQLVILDPHLDTELIEIIRLQPEWNIDFEDDEMVIITIAKRQ